MYCLSFCPEIISIIVSFSQPTLTYPINKIWSQTTYMNMNKRIRQHNFNIAVENGYSQLVKKLLPDINPNVSYEEDWNSLCVASFYNYKDIVNILMNDNRIDVNSYIGENYTPLMIACDEGCIDSVKELFNCHKLDPNIQDSQGYTALMIASFQGHANIVKFLLNNKNVNRKLKDIEGFTYLKHAREGGHYDIFKKIKTIDN